MIEFQYFEGCPNAKATLDNLLEIRDDLNLSESDIRIVQVPDIVSAGENRFQGSPTILVRGIDIYTEARPEGFNYSCRVYSFAGEQTGIIPKDYIKEKILKYRK